MTPLDKLKAIKEHNFILKNNSPVAKDSIWGVKCFINEIESFSFGITGIEENEQLELVCGNPIRVKDYPSHGFLFTYRAVHEILELAISEIEYLQQELDNVNGRGKENL